MEWNKYMKNGKDVQGRRRKITARAGEKRTGNEKQTRQRKERRDMQGRAERNGREATDSE